MTTKHASGLWNFNNYSNQKNYNQRRRIMKNFTRAITLISVCFWLFGCEVTVENEDSGATTADQIEESSGTEDNNNSSNDSSSDDQDFADDQNEANDQAEDTEEVNPDNSDNDTAENAEDGSSGDENPTEDTEEDTSNDGNETEDESDEDEATDNTNGSDSTDESEGNDTVEDEPDNSSDNDIGGKIVVSSSWSGGFNGEIKINYQAEKAITGWELQCDKTIQIDSLWNAEIISNDSKLIIENVEWNKYLKNGSQISIGFTASGSMTQTSFSNCYFAGESILFEIEFQSNSNNGTSGSIKIEGIDETSLTNQITIEQGQHSFILSTAKDSALAVLAFTNNSDCIDVNINGGSTLHITAKKACRASVKLVDPAVGTRVIGVRVRTVQGDLPGFPDYLAIGSVSEDSATDLNFWQSFEEPSKNKRMDIRYIYLNGGPYLGWTTWNGSVNQRGGRAISYIRESLKLGMIPAFVYYNIPDGGESYYTNKQHISDPQYMQDYFKDLKLALDIIQQEAPDEKVIMILEPDFLGYLAQNSENPLTMEALTHGAYDAGVLGASDPKFPDTVRGLVEAINYTISKYAPNVEFGWQMNLWALPPGGYTTPISGKGIMHLTDTMGDGVGRDAVYKEATAVTQYYIDSGVLTPGAKFLSIDKYGLDAVGFEASAASNPGGSTWFWNAEHWMNYLTFVRAMHDKSELPIVLWQLPIGHIDESLDISPYHESGKFPVLGNTGRSLEDSTTTFFFGDTFISRSETRRDFFADSAPGSTHVSINDNQVTWNNHWQEAREAGVTMALFGAGVGASTKGVGDPSDHYWWIDQVQEYYLNPLPLD